MTRRDAVATLAVAPVAFASLADLSALTVPSPDETADILLLHSSRSGQTRRITEFLAQRARHAGHDVAVHDLAAFAQQPRRRLPDVVIIAAGIQFGRHDESVCDFVRSHRDELQRGRAAFISVSLSAAQPARQADAEGYIRTFLQETDWHPDATHSAAGALRYRRYGLLKRIMMKQIARQGGLPTDTSLDHEFTDWRSLALFGDGFLAAARTAD